MKKLKIIILLTCLVMVGTSCKTLSIFGKSSKQVVNQGGKIDDVTAKQNANLQDKMSQISVLSSGTDHAVNKITNKEPAVTVAKELNERVMSLAGKPDFNAEKEMWKMVDDLTSQLHEERLRGLKNLNRQDTLIGELQDKTKLLVTEKNNEIDKYRKLASDTAGLADTRKAELDEFTGWFGLKAVFKGLWQFVKSMAWILTGLGVVYFILRAFAATNPIVGAIFGIVEQIAGGIIHVIQGFAPRAATFAKFVPKTEFDGYENTLTKLIDTFQLMKDTQKRTGDLEYTLDEILAEFDKAMNDEDKARVKKIKAKMGW